MPVRHHVKCSTRCPWEAAVRPAGGWPAYSTPKCRNPGGFCPHAAIFLLGVLAAFPRMALEGPIQRHALLVPSRGRNQMKGFHRL